MRAIPLSVSIIGFTGFMAFAQEQATLAQEVRVIPDSVSCDTCVIERYKIATIHDWDFPPGAIVLTGDPHVNSDGTFFVIAGPIVNSRLYLADSTGSIVRRIGKDGEGPGEYRAVSDVHELPGAYLVFDPMLNRVTRLSKGSFEVLGTAPFPPFATRTSYLVFGDGSYLIYGTNRTREGFGHPFHLFDASGNAIRSFGGGEGVPPSLISTLPRILGVSRDGTFWAASRRQYRLEHWDREGNLLEVLERESDWHPHYQLDASGQLPRVRRSRVQQLWEDEDGLLWVLGQQAKGEVGPGSTPDLLASIIEVIDPVAGTLVAKSRVEGVEVWRARGGFHQMVHKENPETFLVSIEVWGARFEVGSRNR